MTWVWARPATSLFTTTVTQAEILYGLKLLPSAKRRSRLEAAVHEMFAIDLAGRVLLFDQAAAQAYAEIAAIARSQDAGVATRNGADFEGCGISVINPWRV